MEIKTLPQEVRSQLRNGTNINNITQCVTELVLNSLDAKSTAIAVRVNLLTFQIQVVDNGKGITQSNMIPIGNRFMTSKCQSLADLKNIKYFGFRGEALASIRGISKSLSISSRPEDVDNTYSKVYKNGKWGEIECIKRRPSKGTTVTIEGFMNKLPVRQKRINQSVDMENIKKMLESLAIINSKVSFNLRNDANGKTILKSSKTLSVSQALINFYPHISIENLVQVKVSRDKITISGLIYKSTFSNNKLQFLYLNKRVIISPKIQKLVNSLLSKIIFQKPETQAANNCLDKNISNKNEYPVYVLNIRCPFSEVDLTLCPTKKNVEFKNWDIILACFKKAINSLEQNEKLVELNHSKKVTNKVEKLPLKGCQSQFGISQIDGVIKSIPIRRNRLIEKPNESSLETVNEDKSSDQSSDIQMLNPEAKSHCDDTIEKPLRENEKEISPNSKVGEKRKIKETSNDDVTKKSKIEENLHDSDSFFDVSIAKSEEKKTVKKAKKKTKTKTSKAPNNKIKNSPVVIPLKKVAERVGAKILDNVADNCEDLSFGNTNHSCLSIFCQNKSIKEKLKNLTDKGNDSKNTEQPQLNCFLSERKSTSNQSNMENEGEGKKFIMDMFLKSSAMFPNDEKLNTSKNANTENKDEVDSRVIDSAEGKAKQSYEETKKRKELSTEETKKRKELSTEELLPKICFGKYTLNDMKMPQFGSMDCFRQPIVYENINMISEEFYKPVCVENVGKEENIFENRKYRTKSICYTKSVYKTTMPKSVLNLDTYQQWMEPEYDGNCFNMNQEMLTNFENNFANYNKKSRNAPIPLYQRPHSKNHIPKMNDVIFQQQQFNYNFSAKRINSFGLKFFKNFDRKVNSNFEKQDHVFKSVHNKLQAVELYKSTIKPSVFNIPSKPKNLVYNNNLDYAREKLYQSVFQPWIPAVKTKNQDHVFKMPYVSVETKQVRKIKNPFSMEYICRSPYFRQPKEKRKIFSKNHQKICHVRENRPNDCQKVVDKNILCSPYFKKNENRICQNDEMNESKYFKRKKTPLLLDINRNPNFFDQVKDTGKNTNFMVHLKNPQKISSLPVSPIDNYQHLEPIFLKDPEVIEKNPYNFFPKTKSVERTEFIECPQKKPQRSKLSLKKLNSSLPDFLTDPSNTEFQEKSIYFQEQALPKSLFHIGQFNNNQNRGNDCKELELPSHNSNINITFKSGKMVYQEKDETCAFVNDDFAKNPSNSTAGFKHFQPILSSTFIDSISPIADERVEENVKNKEADNPNNIILSPAKVGKNCNYALEEVPKSINFFSTEECLAYNKNNNIYKKIEPRRNSSILNVTIEDLKKKLATTSTDNHKNNVDTNDKSTTFDENKDCEKIESRKNCSVLNVTIDDLKKLVITPKDDCITNVKNNGESKKIYNVLNASILSLNRALLTSFKMNSETQKNCNMLNTSIADLKSIFSEVNNKKENNFEVLKSLPKNPNREQMEQLDKHDNFNLGTGTTSIIKPCENSIFSLAPRVDLLPNKSSSPFLLKESKQIDVSLSPKSKQALNNVILESHEDELNTIKWANLINEFTDAKQFFDDLYREKTKQFDRLIPNVSVDTLPRGILKICNNLEAESITKNIFEDLTIIGQWDHKFIIALIKAKGMVVLFDQHAVHERIRLENLLEEYIEADQETHRFKSTQCNEPVVFELNDSEINILLHYQHLLEDLGLIYKISTNNIYIFYVPTCIYNRILKHPKKYQEIELKHFVCSLVCEEINTILSTRGIGIKIPILMQNILNSEACRGAIKFGDELNLNECADLIQKLSKCKLPFQCAHGRPTIAPIINLQQNIYNKKPKINLEKLK